MSFGSSSDSFKVKTFETQEEINEKKRKRQEQWEKVRKPDDPEDCPEEETRSLFEQLQANKESKEKEFEDQQRIRNSVQGLEEEEAKFLNFVSSRQVQLERERAMEENVVLEQMKAAVKRVTEKSPAVAEVKKSAPSSSATKKSQQSLLSGAIKRKSTETSSEDGNKRKRSESEDSTNSNAPSQDKLLKLIDTSVPVAQIAGILPGIGSYDEETSDSNSSSSESDIEDYLKTKKTVIRINVQQL